MISTSPSPGSPLPRISLTSSNAAVMSSFFPVFRYSVFLRAAVDPLPANAAGPTPTPQCAGHGPGRFDTDVQRLFGIDRTALSRAVAAALCGVTPFGSAAGPVAFNAAIRLPAAATVKPGRSA